MKTILEKLIDNVPKDYSIIRVDIKEDENYGFAIIQRSDGTPQNWSYDRALGVWV